MNTTGRWNRWLAAGMMLLGVALILFWTRPTPVPELPTFAQIDDSDLQGQLAYVTSVDGTANGESRTTCVRMVDLPVGASFEVICQDSLGPALAWTEDGRLVVQDDDAVRHQDPHFGRGLLLLDPTGTRIPERVAYEGDPEDFWPTDLHLRDDGSVLVLEETGSTVIHRTADGSAEPLLEMERTPPGYSIFHLQWSPDGRYFMAVDTNGRVIIALAEDPRPGVFVTGVEPAGIPVAWYIEGHLAHTVKVAELVPH